MTTSAERSTVPPGTSRSVALAHASVSVTPGPALLAGLGDGPALAAHELRYGPLPSLDARDLAVLAETLDVRGRGGAGFPFARKVVAAAETRGRAVVVVNVSEGEPASHKDAVLALVAPHLVLDGAAVTARAVGAGTVHLVVPREQPRVRHALEQAVAERAGDRRTGLFGRGHGAAGRDRGLSWTVHLAEDRFVAGQASAVVELMSGRPNLPVTAWQPVTVAGYKGRPTLLSNAETFAHVGRLALTGLADAHRLGSRREPGTTLLTVDGDAVRASSGPRVVEVPLGTPWHDVLSPEDLASPVLLGGYHGTWAAPGLLGRLTVSRTELAAHGLSLGAGVVLPLRSGCPVDHTARVVGYLASQSARRCGPCLNGLPALASALEGVRDGRGGVEEVERLGSMVTGRGACAHPDGTVRLVRSLLTSYGEELGRHAQHRCGYAAPGGAAGQEPR